MHIAIHDTKLGLHRGNPRLWLQGRRLTRIGAAPGTQFRVLPNTASRSITIEITAEGDRRVSGDAGRPVIDINNPVLWEALGDVERIQAVFEPGRIVVTVHPDEAAEEERRERLLGKLDAGEALDIGSLFHGAGVLDAAMHAGLAHAGVPTRLAFAVELEERFLETSLRNNPVWDERSIAICGSVDAVDLSRLPKVEALWAGIPCTGASLSGRAKNAHLRGMVHAEEHPAAGHLFVAFLGIVRATQPGIVLIENVVPYATTPSMAAIRGALGVMGYDIHEATLDGYELGSLEDRKRLCAIAVTKGLDLTPDLVAGLVAPRPRPANVGAILSGPEVEHRWSACEGLRAKEARDAAKVAETGRGSGFPMQVLTAGSERVGVIGKDYHKWRSTEPKLADESRPGLLRQFDPAEHAAIKGIPFALVEGETPTLQHQMLGQSIAFPAFEAVGRHLGALLVGLRRIVERREASLTVWFEANGQAAFA